MSRAILQDLPPRGPALEGEASMPDKHRARARAADRLRAARTSWARQRELVVTAVERGLQLVLEHWPAERRDRFWRGIGLLSDAPEDDDVPATDATNKQRISPIGELDSWETEILCTSVASVAPQAGELGDCATCGKPTRNRGPDGDFCCSFCAERAALLAEDDGEVPFA